MVQETSIEGGGVGSTTINQVVGKQLKINGLTAILPTGDTGSVFVIVASIILDTLGSDTTRRRFWLSYIVAIDGVMQWVHDVPRGGPALKEDNPSAAALESARSRGRRSTRGSTRLFLEPRTQRLIGTPDDQIRDQDDDAKTTNERGELHEADASLQ